MDFYPIIANFQPLAANLTSLSGLSYSSLSFVKMTAAGTFGLDTGSYQSLATNLTSLSTLSYVSASFVKMTASGTFGLDTATYITTETDPVFVASAAYGISSGNISNWNTAYGWGNWSHTTLSGYGITDACPLAHKTTEDAINGLVKVNGSGTYSAGVAGTDYQKGTLTATRVPYSTGSPGTLTDSANLTFDGSTLTVGSNQTFVVDTVNQCAYVNYGGPETTFGLTVSKTYSSLGTPVAGVYGSATNTAYSLAKTGTVASVYGLYYGCGYLPSSNLNYNATLSSLYGVYVLSSVVSYAGESKTITVTEADGFLPTFSFATGTGSGGAITATKVYNFKAANPVLTAGASGGATPTVTTLCAFYDPGMTAGGTNWGWYGLSAANYFSGTVQMAYPQINTAPTGNSTGVDTILDRTITGASNAGWLPIKDNTGTVRYVPYWN